jgi:hypothetical protein
LLLSSLSVRQVPAKKSNASTVPKRFPLAGVMTQLTQNSGEKG